MYFSKVSVALVLFLVANGFLNPCFAQPANNTVGSASVLTPATSCASPTSGTLASCTSDGISSTCAATTNDVWYRMAVPSGVTQIALTVIATNTFPSGTAYLEVYNASTAGAVSSGTSRVCGDALTGLNLTGLTSGSTYYLRLFTTGNVNSNPSNKWAFTICASYATAPTNDDCSSASSLTMGTSANGTVWLATASAGIPVGCATGDPDDDVWYSFNATASSTTIALSALGTDLSTSGARMQLFSGSCGTLSSITCGTTNISSTSLSVGTTYYVRVYSNGTGALGASSSGSTFTITASVSPGNDECSTAYLIPTGSSCLKAEGTVVGATQSAGIPIGVCTGTPDDDVWFKFIAQKSSPTITLSSLGTNLSASGSRLQLLSGNCGSLSSLSCGTTSIAASGLVTGNTYYVRVYSSGATPIASNGAFNICITDPSPDLVADSTTTLFTIDTVCRQLGYPWEVTYGPDDSLWITEARGYRVLRISGTRTNADRAAAPQQILKLPLNSSEVSFGRSIGTWPQGGMEGLAIHPEFMTNPAKRWVYLAYVYSGTCSGGGVPCYFRSKIVRCRFYFAADAGNPTSVPKRDTLVIMDTVISNLPGSNDHNSGRLVMSPTMEGGSYKLYYTIGDMGAGQFNNASRTNYAQFKDTCEGKILRLNTEPDGDAAYPGVTHNFNTYREWIPNDNPFKHSQFPAVPTPIYSYGHRNAQGLSWGQVNGTWRLYSSEHGDHSDDEVNILESGKNYGWPKVAGLADNNYTTADDVSDGFTYNNALASVTVTNETTWASAQPDYKNPVFSFFNWNPAMIEPSNTGNLYNWPTIAPSSIEFYGGNIPGWKNSLLVTSLKYGMFRLKLTSNGDAIDSTVSSIIVDTIPLLHGWRVRDAAINPNPISGVFWVVIDSSGATSGPTGGFSGANSTTKDGGKVLKLTYKTLLTLGVEFISFKGKLLPNQTIGLTWEANADNNHDYFDVEKKVNGTWTTIGRVSTGPPYYFVDIHPIEGDNLYRIKAVENTGKLNYSTVVNVKYQSINYIVSIYPNPVQDQINLKVNSPKAVKLQLRVIDMQGKVLVKQAQYLSVGLSQISIPVAGWPSQPYLVELMDETGLVIYKEKVLKN